MGRILRCISNDGLVMISAIDSTDIVKRMIDISHPTPVMTSAMGRLLTGASLMGIMLKEDNASLTVRVAGKGPGGALIAVSDSSGNVRGYAENPGLLIMPDLNGRLDVSGAVGKDGTIAVIKDLGYGEPYIGQVPLVSGEIAEDLAYYYGISEQTATVFALGVHFDEKWNFSRAGGCFIQLLPAADDREAILIESSLKKVKPVMELFKDGLSLEEICRTALPDFELEVLDEFPVEYKCPCSLERVLRSLSTLQPDEIVSLAGDDGYAEVCCHFCERKYKLSRDELIDLAETLKNKE